MENGEYHIPVLLRQSVDGLDIKPGGIYVGGGTVVFLTHRVLEHL